MKKSIGRLITIALLTCMVAAPAFAAGDKVRGDKAAGPAGESGQGLVKANRGNDPGAECLAAGTLSGEEAAHIQYIRMEEKLARDVYLSLYNHYAPDPLQANIFLNISNSEQRHMDKVKALMERYGIDDPVEDDTVGVFPDTEDNFAAQYEELVLQGEESYCRALETGVLIEELDIDDIDEALLDVTAPDVGRVLTHLQNGSYNHLNAYTGRIALNCQ